MDLYELLDEKLQHDCQEQTHQIVGKYSYVESGISFPPHHSYHEVIRQTNSTINNTALHKIFLASDTITDVSSKQNIQPPALPQDTVKRKPPEDMFLCD